MNESIVDMSYSVEHGWESSMGADIPIRIPELIEIFVESPFNF
jgi:hypothetical protein